MENPLLIYSAYFVAIVSLIGNYIQYRIKRGDDKKASLRDKRFNLYTEYFSKVDRVNSQLYLAQNSQEVQDKIKDLVATMAKISSGGGTKEDTEFVRKKYGEIMTEQSEILTNWVREQNALLDEVNKLKLIASEEVASILERYSEVMQRALESSAELPMQAALSGPGQMNLESMLDYGELQNELKSIRKDLHSAMRKDMGVEE